MVRGRVWEGVRYEEKNRDIGLDNSVYTVRMGQGLRLITTSVPF